MFDSSALCPASAQDSLNGKVYSLSLIHILIVGIFTVVTRGVKVVGSLFDNSALKEELSSRLQCYVMLDPLPFDSLDQADPNQIKEYAIWTTVNNALATNGSLDSYEPVSYTHLYWVTSLASPQNTQAG